MVLMQTTMCPGCALLMMPCSPVMTDSACVVVSTMQMVRATLAATASAEVARVAPRVFQTSALPGSMSCTTSEKPCLTRFSAIGPPMFPSPMNPTVPAITPPSLGSGLAIRHQHRLWILGLELLRLLQSLFHRSVTASLAQIGGAESLAVLATGICARGEQQLHDLQMSPGRRELRSEERRVGKECRSR